MLRWSLILIDKMVVLYLQSIGRNLRLMYPHWNVSSATVKHVYISILIVTRVHWLTGLVSPLSPSRGLPWCGVTYDDVTTIVGSAHGVAPSVSKFRSALRRRWLGARKRTPRLRARGWWVCRADLVRLRLLLPGRRWAGTHGQNSVMRAFWKNVWAIEQCIISSLFLGGGCGIQCQSDKNSYTDEES